MTIIKAPEKQIGAAFSLIYRPRARWHFACRSALIAHNCSAGCQQERSPPPSQHKGLVGYQCR